MNTSLTVVVPLGLALAGAAAAVARSRSRAGAQRRFWALLGLAATAWAVGRAAAALEASSSTGGDPAPVLALAGILAWPVLATTAVAMLSASLQTRQNLLRDVLDCFLLAAAGLMALWSFVVRPLVDGAAPGAVPWVLLVAVALSIDAPLTSVHALLRSPERGADLRLALLGTVVVTLGDVASTHRWIAEGHGGGAAAAALWTCGWGAVLVGALVHRGRAQQTAEARLRGGPAMAHCAAGVTILVDAAAVLTGRNAADPVTSWASTAVLTAVVCRTLLELRRTSRLQRVLERRIEERTRALAHSRHRFAALVAHSTDLVVVLDAEGRLTYANPGASALLGVDHGATVGLLAVDHLHASEDSARMVQALRAMVAGGVGHHELRMALRRADGHRRDVEAVVTNLMDDPDICGLVINARDVTEALRLERELSEQAFSDALTGLPNRALFCDRLEQALRSRASRGPVKVCFLDLDGFKAVNDTLGHDAGDELLVAVAQRLGAALREGDTVARLGGDEFAVLLDEGVQLDEARELAQRICDALGAPFTVSGSTVHVGTSVGIASSRTAGRSAEELMRAADLAMYEAKSRGGGGWAVYTPLMQEALAERVQLETDLRRAVEQGQFRVVYQPLVDMGTGSVSGVEALVRWHHPERGVVSPVAFIPLAEATGLIDAIGAHVLREACQQVAVWRSEVPGAEDMRVSVNLSAHQLDDPGLLALVTTTLRETGLPATSLVLEVTESALVDQHAAAIEVLGALRALGIRLAIDDFGTGYSSLSYLHRLPVDILKIDKSFVDRLGAGQDGSLVDAILGMAATLGLATVAEGIEHEHQRSSLAAQGCSTGQGYHFSPPVAPELVPELVLAALRTPTGPFTGSSTGTSTGDDDATAPPTRPAALPVASAGG